MIACRRLDPSTWSWWACTTINLKGQIAQALQDASANGVIRVLDALAVQKTADGQITSGGATDLTPEQREVYGARVGALLGLGMTDSEEGAQLGAERGARLRRAPLWPESAGYPGDGARHTP